MWYEETVWSSQLTKKVTTARPAAAKQKNDATVSHCSWQANVVHLIQKWTARVAFYFSPLSFTHSVFLWGKSHGTCLQMLRDGASPFFYMVQTNILMQECFHLFVPSIVPSIWLSPGQECRCHGFYTSAASWLPPWVHWCLQFEAGPVHKVLQTRSPGPGSPTFSSHF